MSSEDPDRSASAARGLNLCPRCGARFSCGMQQGMGRCWCGDFPPVKPLSADPASAQCLCPECLQHLARQ